MADLRSILTDPNYTGANAATKRAIFERYSAQDPNYLNANEATKQAIQAKYGVSAVAAAPAAPPMSVEAMQDQAMAATDLPVAPAPAAAQPQFIGQSIPQVITAPIELAATGVTGATTGMLGYAAGAGAGLIESIRNGTYGTRVGGQQMAQRALQGLQQYTYAPRTQMAQEAFQALEEIAQEAKLAPVPVTAVPQVLSRGVLAQTRAAVPAVAAVPRAISQPRIEPSVGPESQAAVRALEQQFAPLTADQQMQRMGMPAAQQPEVTPTSIPTATETTAAFDELGALVRKASGGGMGSSTAKARLADAAQVNTDARAAAERLGIDLPFDVFSDNPQIRAAVGLTRSQAGGEAEAAWQTTLANAINRSDEVIQQFDAAFIEGRVAPGATSQRILDNLKSTQDQLAQESSALYRRVDEVIPKTTTVEFPRLVQTLDEVTAEVGEKGLTTQEKRLYELATDPAATYGRLLREKNLIGQAVSGKESPYGNMDAASLKRLYAALAEDQLTNVGSIAGESVRKELRAANLLTAKKKALEKRIIGAFGKEIDGSVATLMQSAIKSASKGDAAQFNKLMKVVPPDLQKETIATALAAVSSSSRAAQTGAFGFAEFAKTYSGLRSNPPVYKKVIEILGPEAGVVLRDLYEVSRRITEARANVLTTGKANQALVESMRSESMIGKVMQTTMAQRAATGVASMFPIAGFFAPDIINLMTRAKSDAVKSAGKLFASEEFQKLAIEAATKAKVSDEALKKTANSQEFRAFAKAAKLPKSLAARVSWLRSALRSEDSTKKNPAATGVINEQNEAIGIQPKRAGDGERGYAIGSLAPLAGAPQIKGASGPDPRLIAVAEQYARDKGIRLRRQSEYAKVDKDRARRIAEAYEAMPHAPQDPVVREAYQNLIRQTMDQYKALESYGYRFWFIDIDSKDGQKYASTPWNAMRDLRENKSLGVFPTDSGFGTSADFNPEANPLLEDTGLKWPFGSPNGELRTVYANDLFRAVHDVFGHGLEGSGFRAQGEENAWQAHARLFTGSALGALTSETRGQNSWLNFGPYGETNRTAKVEDTVFADQKTGLMPEWTWTEGLVGDEPIKPQQEQQ